MKDNPLISVIIPTYNRAYCLSRAVSSVQKQSFQDFEIIIVDDASNDNTKDVVDRLHEADKRIKYYKSLINAGVSAARNIGLEIAQGHYINFLDSDDELFPDSLKQMLDFIEINEDDLIISRFTPETPVFSTRFESENRRLYSNDTVNPLKLIESICKNNHFCLGTILWKHEFLHGRKIKFRTRMRAGSDKVILVESLRQTKRVKMLNVVVLKVNHDSTNSIIKQHKMLWHKIVHVKSRGAILWEVIHTLNPRLFLLSSQQFLISIKRIAFHFLIRMPLFFARR